jgi:hypothetical protein
LNVEIAALPMAVPANVHNAVERPEQVRFDSSCSVLA